MRIEHDTMGDIPVANAALWGANTERARLNMPVDAGRPMPRGMIVALARIKAAYVLAAEEMRLLPRDVAQAIAAAAEAIVRGEHADAFPLDVFQTGSGTSSNMNVNEVLANLANLALGGQLGVYRPVHPNDHVNFGQSSNDTVPAALHLALLDALRELLPALRALARAFAERAERDGEVLKTARTHLQDALPITFGHVFRADAAVLDELAQSLEDILPRLSVLPLGGTAVGTGFQCPVGLPERACARLSDAYNLPLRIAAEPLVYMAGRPAVNDASGRLAALAGELIRLASDLRLLSSGPRLGFGEIRLPDLQPGSSIMPGKVNPVVLESVIQVGLAVLGQHQTILTAAAFGQLELNVTFPITAQAILSSTAWLTRACELLRTRVVEGMTLNREALARHLDASLALATALIGKIGYARAAEVAKHAAASGQTVAESALALGVLSADEIPIYLAPALLTQRGRL